MENNFLGQITDTEMRKAKERIWSNMQGKLPDRGISPYMNVGRVLRKAGDLQTSRLMKFQLKERMFNSLQDLAAAPSYESYFRKWKNLFAQKRVWSMAVLSAVFMFIFAPIFSLAPMASAGSNTSIEVTQGIATIIRQSETIEVTEEAVLIQGDRIELAEDSMAHVYFIDDSQMTLGPGAQILLTELYVNPGNKAMTEVVIDQFSGRAWTQVLNLVGKNSFFAHRFPDGEVSATQRASFDVSVEPDISKVEVARNLVDILVNKEDRVYSGTIGQGVKLEVSDEEIVAVELSVEEKNDVWWKFNLAFEKSYARTVDEKYKNEAIKQVLILPGNPLYKLKTFQENVQSLVTFTKSAKREFAMTIAQKRLDEAQALIAKGAGEEKISTVLDKYEEAVNQALELSMKDADANTILADTEEAQKAVYSLQTGDAGTEMLKSTVSSTAALSFENPVAKNENMLQSASQRLQTVPDLIETGNFDLAMQFLNNYRDESRLILVELESVQLQEREVLIVDLLDTKLKDLQMLRIISAMPQLSGAFNMNAQMMSEMSMVVLSLRERELQHLGDFFSASADDPRVQKILYEKLKNSVDIDENLRDLLLQIEEQLELSNTGLVMDIQVSSAPVDHRLNTHSDESQDEAESGYEGADYPESHDDL